MLSILEVSNGVNESNSKDQCDKKCGFFGTRDVSKITKSNCSMFTYVLRGVLIPSVGILGLIGNTLSIIVFNRPEMKIWNFNGSYEMTKTSFFLISKKYFIKDKRQSTYRKVASSRLSQLAARPRSFRLFMKRNFDAYLL